MERDIQGKEVGGGGGASMQTEFKKNNNDKIKNGRFQHASGAPVAPSTPRRRSESSLLRRFSPALAKRWHGSTTASAPIGTMENFLSIMLIKTIQVWQSSERAWLSDVLVGTQLGLHFSLLNPSRHLKMQFCIKTYIRKYFWSFAAKRITPCSGRLKTHDDGGSVEFTGNRRPRWVDQSSSGGEKIHRLKIPAGRC